MYGVCVGNRTVVAEDRPAYVIGLPDIRLSLGRTIDLPTGEMH